MKIPKDIFSEQSKAYKKFRPHYPPGLYRELLKFVDSKKACWDCGTGNGQVALALAPYFQKVYATDISHRQIEEAKSTSNIIFTVERVEKTNFTENQFDLITAAQAVHWFSIEAFNQEVGRLAKNGAILAIWGYGLLRMDPSIDPVLDDFYSEIVGPYWDEERKHIDSRYAEIRLDFPSVPVIPDWSIKVAWNLEHLQGYLNTWSSVQKYKTQHEGENPVDPLIRKIRPLWKGNSPKNVEFPVFLRAVRVEK